MYGDHSATPARTNCVLSLCSSVPKFDLEVLLLCALHFCSTVKLWFAFNTISVLYLYTGELRAAPLVLADTVSGTGDV